MKTIADLDDFTIFTEIAKIGTLKIFDYVSAENCDLYYKNAYTEKPIAPIMDRLTQSQIATIIYGFFHEKWDTLVDYILKANETVLNNGEKETKTQTTTGDETDHSETENTVSAYNTDDYSNNDKSVTDRTNKTTGGLDYTIIRENNNLLEKSIDYLKTEFIYDTVFSDVSSIITLSIFDSAN